MVSHLYDLETLLVDAWPAVDAVDLEGWLLRASGGPTHRGNSIATHASKPSVDLDRRIQRAEAWYRERGQPVLFYIGPCASPPELDALLAERGYAIEGPSLFAAAPPSEVVARTTPLGGPNARLVADVESSPSSAWREVKATASRFAGQLEGLLGFIGRLGARCRFVTVRTESGVAAAVALGIASGRRLGIYAMLTVPEFRRRGAARAALHALAESALGDGLSELYLLVEHGNPGARRLYEQSGFRDVFSYHYRRLSLVP